jgi:hypothetical protein
MANPPKPPGDNRGADDVDGNKSAGATQAPGVRDPELPPGDNPAGGTQQKGRDAAK